MSKHVDETKPEPTDLTPGQNLKYTLMWTVAAVLALWLLFAVTASPSQAAPARLPGSSVSAPACADPQVTYYKDGPIYRCGDIHLNKNGKAMVRCAGAAALGSLKGGGVYGAAIAGAGCTFATVMS